MAERIAFVAGIRARSGAGAALRPDRVESALRRSGERAPLAARARPRAGAALFAGARRAGAARGASHPRRRSWLRPGGALALEHAPDQADGRGRGLSGRGSDGAFATSGSGGATPRHDGNQPLLTRRVSRCVRGVALDRIVVRGNGPLRGEVEVSGSKNACLALMAAALLADEARRCSRTCPGCAMSMPCSSCCARSARAPSGRASARTSCGSTRAASTAARRPTTWCARCARPSWCSVRWSAASARRASPSPAAARSAFARSTNT